MVSFLLIGFGHYTLLEDVVSLGMFVCQTIGPMKMGGFHNVSLPCSFNWAIEFLINFTWVLDVDSALFFSCRS